MEHEFVPAAEAMPEDKFGFAPTIGEFKGVLNDVPILQSYFEFIDVIPINRVVAEVLDLIALGLIIDQWSVDVGLFHQVARIVFAHQLRILAAAERLNLPTGRAIVGLDLCHALDGDGLA